MLHFTDKIHIYQSKYSQTTNLQGSSLKLTHPSHMLQSHQTRICKEAEVVSNLHHKTSEIVWPLVRGGRGGGAVEGSTSRAEAPPPLLKPEKLCFYQFYLTWVHIRLY